MGLPENLTTRHRIEVENGEEIAAVHHEADSNKWIFICHGLASNKERGYEKMCESFRKEGYNAVRFDFRGNGDSDGEFQNQSVSSKIQDLKNVVEFFDPERFVLFGSSFGGKTAFHATEELDPELLIFQKPVLMDRNAERYEKLVEEDSWELYGGKSFDMSFVEDYRRFNFNRTAKNLEIPVLIFHGGADEIISFEDTADAIKHMKTEVTLYKLPRQGHSFDDSSRKTVRNTSLNWLNQNGF